MAHQKPLYATDYTPEQLDRSRRALLQVAVALGDYLPDVVLVGGLVPTLLVDQEEAATRDASHIGSADVDLGLHFAVIDEERYDAFSDRLMAHGFEPGISDKGHPTKQRWIYEGDDEIAVDFLIDNTETDEGDWNLVMHLTGDLAALRTQGLTLAFEDAEDRKLRGTTLRGDVATRELRVCGPAAFIVLKAIAFRNRAAGKDAYDLAYVLRNYAERPEVVGERVRQYLGHPATAKALTILREEFGSEEKTGPRSASRFLWQDIQPEYVADLVGDVRLFLAAAGQ